MTNSPTPLVRSPRDRGISRQEMAMLLVAALATCLFMAWIGKFGFVHNFNYRIMEFYSGVLRQGGNPYTVPAPEAFFDFPHSGLQAVALAGIFWLDDRLPFSVFHLVQHGHMLLALLGGLWLARRRILAPAHLWMLLLLTVLNPLVWYYMVQYPSDNYFILSMPVVLSVLAVAQWRLACFLAGLFAAFAGTPVFAVPVLLLERMARPLTWRSPFGRAVLVGGALAAAGLAAGMVPLFPDALSGWALRSEREALMPFWFSLWHLAGAWYLPGFNTVATLLLLALVYLWRLRGGISLHQAILLSFSLFLILSSNQVIGRMLPLAALAVLYFRSPRVALLYGAGAFLWSLAVLVLIRWVPWLLDNGGSPGRVLAQVLLFNAPVLAWLVLGVAEGVAARRAGGGGAAGAAGAGP